MNRIGRIDSPAAAQAYLSSRLNYERSPASSYDARSFRLERMQRLVGKLPVDVFRVPVIHVAGTKGKGSTSAMLASILTTAGFRAGLYSSPHLYRLEERFAVDGVPCSEEELTSLVASVAEAAEALVPSGAAQGPAPHTYFELTTAMAMLHFARRDVDVAVLEVGLGGRLDSTNICRPTATVITSISLDHTRLLGETVAEIAAEKAGIIKPGVPVISGVTDPAAADVIAEKARSAAARLFRVGVDFDYEYTSPQHLERCATPPRVSIALQQPPAAWAHTLAASPAALADLRLGLLGRHQAANAAAGRGNARRTRAARLVDSA
ncbi:MAG: Mur ligase family protein [Pirellulales bacterium]